MSPPAARSQRTRQTDSTSVYEPSSASSNDSHLTDTHHEDCNPLEEKKFIVSASKMLGLFNTCKRCNRFATASIQQVVGTMVKIAAECEFCSFKWQWCSQPYPGSIPAVNIGLSSSILFSGALATKVLRVLQCMGVATISSRTLTTHQSTLLFPAITRVWDKNQHDYLRQAKERNQPFVIGGDGRADSPGHCAKFGSYSTTDLEEGVVIDIKLVQEKLDESRKKCSTGDNSQECLGNEDTYPSDVSESEESEEHEEMICWRIGETSCGTWNSSGQFGKRLCCVW
ncbi:uncharacterized protein LOC130053822 [Ostrea edulis]|uniref:uncharacterized protein LOC130053822 n=1 Tax=Ostrea edulis TaxID=37623 RepID=UPI0024AF2D28|nr:uncharacterized protein LOC130053822 [Ostrea edulis]